MNVTWDQFLPLMSVQLADCPDVIAYDALRRAAFKFCYESYCWQQENDPQNVTAGVADYDLDFPSGTIPAHLMSVVFKGTPLYPKTAEQLDLTIPGWHDTESTPLYYFRPTDSTIRLVPMPSTTESAVLRTKVILAPSASNGAGVDADVFNKHSTAIIQGALAILMMLPGRKWSNPQLSQLYDQQYRFEISRTKGMMLSANSSAPLKVRGRKFA
jgi:hypothetical protein